MNQSLIDLMALHNLTNEQVAMISDYSVHSIYAYTCKSSWKCHRKLSKRTYKAIRADIDTYARVCG